VRGKFPWRGRKPRRATCPLRVSPREATQRTPLVEQGREDEPLTVPFPDACERHGVDMREGRDAGRRSTPGRYRAPRGATAATEEQSSGGRNPRSVSRMKQAGRVRGGVKPSGGCETLETDRSRELESPADHRGFLVLRALKGTKAQQGTAQLEHRRRRTSSAVASGGHTLQEA